MLSNKHSKTIFILLSFLSICLIPWLGITSSPLFPKFGIWYQSEPIITALFIVGSISLLALLVGLAPYPRLIKWSLYHPVVYLPFIIAITSLLSALVSPNFLSGLLGSVQTGQGVAWFLTIGLLSALARLIFKAFPERFRKVIVLYCLTSIIFISFISILGASEWKMFFFNDHLAFFAIFLWPFPFLVIKDKRIAYVVAVICSVSIVLFSNNFSAEIAVDVMILTTPIYFLLKQKFNSHKHLHSLAAGACVALTIALATTVLFFSNSFLFKALSQKLASTMHSRHLLLNTIIEELKSSPISFLFGNGWGSFSVSLMKNIPFEKTSAFYTGNLSEIDKSTWIWDSLLRFDFHSHNVFVETLGSAGLFGLSLLLFYVFSLVKFSKEKYIEMALGCTIAFILVNSMWFQMPSTVGIMALSFGAVSGQAPFQKFAKNITSKFILSFFILVFLIIGTATYKTFNLATEGAKQVEVNLAPNKFANTQCGPFIDDTSRNGYHFSELFRTYMNRFSHELKENSGSIDIQAWQRVDNFLCQSDKRLQENNELVAGVRGLMARGDLMYKFREKTKEYPQLYNRIVSGWSANLDKVLSLAPHRQDLVILYFNWLLENGQDKELHQRAQKIMANENTKPIGMWFSGIIKLNSPTHYTEGISLMRQAINEGLEKFMPVDENLKTQLTRVGAQ